MDQVEEQPQGPAAPGRRRRPRSPGTGAPSPAETAAPGIGTSPAPPPGRRGRRRGTGRGRSHCRTASGRPSWPPWPPPATAPGPARRTAAPGPAEAPGIAAFPPAAPQRSLLYALYKACQSALTAGLFPPYRVDFPCNPQRIYASNRLVWRKNSSPLGTFPCFKQGLDQTGKRICGMRAKLACPGEIPTEKYQNGKRIASSACGTLQNRL